MIERVTGLQGVPEGRCQEHPAEEYFRSEVVEVSRPVLVPAEQLGQVVRVALMVAPCTHLLGETPTAVDVALRRKRIAQAAKAVRLEITSAVADPRCCAGQSFTRLATFFFCAVPTVVASVACVSTSPRQYGPSEVKHLLVLRTVALREVVLQCVSLSGDRGLRSSEMEHRNLFTSHIYKNSDDRAHHQPAAREPSQRCRAFR